MKKIFFFFFFLNFSLSCFSQNLIENLPFKEDGIYNGIPYINGQPQPYYYDPLTGLSSPSFKEGLVFINPNSPSQEKWLNSSSYFYSSSTGVLLFKPIDNSFQILKKPFKGIGIRKIEKVDKDNNILEASPFVYYPFPVAPIQGNINKE